MRTHFFVFLAASLGLAAAPALAYNEFTHHTLTGRAFTARPEWTGVTLTPPRPEELAAFRALLWRALSEAPDAELRKTFLARFPTEASLDAWGLKEFLMLNPAATVHGLDPTTDDAQPLTRGALLQLASRSPDDDKRNQKRFQFDGQRQVLNDAFGNPLPFDPMTLNIGSLTGTSSQAHAHYAIREQPLSDDPRVLMKDPAGFAQPKETVTFGGEFAQLYTDLAILAATSGQPAGPWLEATFAGASFHHIQDAGNQIHTLQVGPFLFFKAAIGQMIWRELITQGGLFGERAGLVQLGTRIISNHHLILEDLFAKRVRELLEGKPVSADLTAAMSGLEVDDAAFAAEARQKIAAVPASFALQLVKALGVPGGVEGPEVYSLIWQLTAPTLHDGRGHAYDGDTGDDPDTYLQVRGKDDEAALKKFFELEALGLHRSTTAQRLWLAAYEAEVARPDARARAAQRILASLIPYHRAAAERRTAYVPSPPPGKQPIAWAIPAVTLAILALIIWRIRRRLTRARSRLLL